MQPLPGWALHFTLRQRSTCSKRTPPATVAPSAHVLACNPLLQSVIHPLCPVHTSATAAQAACGCRDRTEAYNGTKADVWSAGILLYTLLSGLRPFQEKEDDSESVIMTRATRERHVAALFTRLERLGASEDLVSLLRGMLCADPVHRLSMLDVSPLPPQPSPV